MTDHTTYILIPALIKNRWQKLLIVSFDSIFARGFLENNQKNILQLFYTVFPNTDHHHLI